MTYCKSKKKILGVKNCLSTILSMKNKTSKNFKMAKYLPINVHLYQELVNGCHGHWTDTVLAIDGERVLLPIVT